MEQAKDEILYRLKKRIWKDILDFTESNPLINLEDKIIVENYYSAFDRYAQEEKYGDLLENDR